MIKDNKLSVPSMFIDLDVFEANVKMMAAVAKRNHKTLRMATKSIRCPHLIRHAMKVADGTFKGLMCFSVQEANALMEYAVNEDQHQEEDSTFDLRSAFNDILIAYPTVSESDIETAFRMTQKGVDISLMIDCVQHIRILDAICNRIYCESSPNHSDDRKDSVEHSALRKVSVCIDLDLSYRIKCIGLCIGPRRSNIYDEYDLNCILDAILQSKFLKLSGAMGYEAQVAGVMDDNPFASNWMVRRLKPVLQSDCNERRRSMVQFIRNKIHLINEGGHDDGIGAPPFMTENNLDSFRFVNGGGTGNLEEATGDATCTEVSAGSGLLQSKIFDYYLNSQCRPAAAFALQITRISVDEGYINCQSGGFIASGSPGKDREPVPFLPRKQIVGPFEDIGYGEVNTPLRVRDAAAFHYGDPVFFRPAKAGEIAERFNEYVLKRGDTLCGTVKTYRGMGFALF